MSIREVEPLTEDAARLLNPLRLAYAGDTVWEMLVRMRLLHSGKTVRHMHQAAIAGVNAGAQAAALHRIEHLLTERQTEIVLRGRNAHARHPAPKNQQPADYQAATALEALMGYLYLSGQQERLKALFIASQEETACPQQH